MSKNISFGEYGEYSTGEIAYVIELLAAMRPVDEVQELFLKFTNNIKGLPGAVVQQIQLKYSDRIKRQNDMYLSNINGNPLAHLRVRLDIAYKILRDSLVDRPSHTLKVGEGDFQVVNKKDNPTALNALKLAMQDMAKHEEEEREKAKEDPRTESEDNWNIQDGIG